MENTFATCDKYIIILEFFFFCFRFYDIFRVLTYALYMIYEDVLQNLIIQPSL